MIEQRENPVYIRLDVIALCSCYAESKAVDWQRPNRVDVARVRSGHTKRDGGNPVAWYMVEGKGGELVEVCFDQAELRWYLPDTATNKAWKQWEVEHMLCWYHHEPSIPTLNNRVEPLRFTLIPKKGLKSRWHNLPNRLSPYRIQKAGYTGSFHIQHIQTRHLENLQINRHLHYVVQADTGQYYHVVLEKDLNDWRLIQEVDAAFFFGNS